MSCIYQYFSKSCNGANNNGETRDITNAASIDGGNTAMCHKVGMRGGDTKAKEDTQQRKPAINNEIGAIGKTDFGQRNINGKKTNATFRLTRAG